MSISTAAAVLSLVLASAASAQRIVETGPGERTPPAGPTRSPDGRPGAGYWQQRVDYSVDATLRPDQRLLEGRARVVYHNRSPDELTELWWHLYQNIFRADSDARRGADAGRLGGATRGLEVRRLEIAGRQVAPDVRGTLMRTALPAPLQPGDSVVIEVAWDYEITPYAALRTGSRGRDFGIAQWYPQVAVYDDQRGWNATPYLGYEYYLEYGDWDARLTVPAEYVVAATGTLRNPRDVLTPAQSARLDEVAGRAVAPNRVVGVIAAEETGAARAALAGTRTWRFSAESVRDFVWAASPEYVWDATRTGALADHADGALIHSFYKPGEASTWRQGAEWARDVIERFSAGFGAYVYPQATVVSGPVRGMEYPMLVFTGPADPLTHLDYLVLAHELGHEWFPMMVGSHETSYAWMDEGLASLMEVLALRAQTGGEVIQDLPGPLDALVPAVDERLFYQHFYLASARTGIEVPIQTHSHDAGAGYTVAAYMKPATALYMLRDMLGEATFHDALRAYHARWLFKHPYPADFFNTIEDVAGLDLDWFWEQWFFQTWTLDVAVDGVEQSRGDGGWTAAIELDNQDRAVMPVTLRLWLADGSGQDVRVPVTVWATGDRHVERVRGLPARVVRVELDPEHVLPETDRLDNRWPRARVTVDWKPQIIMDLLPPLDAYRIGLRPSAWYARADGAELGLAATGSYLAERHRVSALVSVGTADGTIDGRLGYETPLRQGRLPVLLELDAFRLDGRVGGELGLRLGVRRAGTFDAATAGIARNALLAVGVRGIELRDGAYLRRPAEWESGLLVAGVTRGVASLAGRAGGARAALTLELAAPGSDWRYGKATAELRASRRLVGRAIGLARLVAGYAEGDVPAQTAFYLAQASPWEQFGSLLFRSENVIDEMGLGDELRMPGGGIVWGAPVDRSGTRLAAANVGVYRGMWELFADAGEAWDTGRPAIDRWVADAGVALRLSPPSLPGLQTDRWSVALRAPLWLHDPASPASSGWDWRFVLVVGSRWGA